MRSNRPTVSADFLPTQSDVEWALLKLLGLRQRPLKLSEVYEDLADDFGLTAGQRTAHMENWNEPAWNNRVRQAKRHLIDQGLVQRSAQRGAVALTAKGRETYQRRSRNSLLDLL